METQTTVCVTKFPYIPTLLAFRELPPALASLKKLKTNPDIILVDGHGRAHPRKYGFACHLGLVTKKPTIGIAKNLLFGSLKRENKKIYITENQEVIGEVITTKEGCRPIYVSTGNMISLEKAEIIVKHLAQNNRIPAPLRIAHNKATLCRKELDQKKEPITS